MTILAKTVICGFVVEVTDLYSSSTEHRVSCFVSKDGYSASLAMIQDYGAIAPDDGHDDIPVKSETIERITTFAAKHGYEKDILQ